MPAGVNQALDEREWQTRKERIDPKLKALGWNVVSFRPGLPLSSLARHAVTEFPTDNGPADYALAFDGRVVAIIEAKKLSLGPQNVLTQAERYARGLPPGEFNFAGLRAPFLYSTNGEVIWFHDVRSPANPSRRTADFHTPAALSEILGRNFDAECVRLKVLPNSHSYLRPYQREANAAIERAIAERKRVMLVAMATARADKLTQSILAKAFRGELVPTEAELARRAGRDYEPASALLDRLGSRQDRDSVRIRRARPDSRSKERAVSMQ